MRKKMRFVFSICPIITYISHFFLTPFDEDATRSAFVKILHKSKSLLYSLTVEKKYAFWKDVCTIAFFMHLIQYILICYIVCSRGIGLQNQF